MKANLKLKTNKIASKLSRKQRELNKVSELAYKEFLRNTPVRSGNARRRTRLKKDTIQANYPYAGRLDDGYSRQSREGMSEPTIKYIQKIVKQAMGK